jgi:methylenetetrahydrofolate reductase (NADPH)
MIRHLSAQGLQGFHICTLNLEKSVTRVLEELQWVRPGGSKSKADTNGHSSGDVSLNLSTSTPGNPLAKLRESNKELPRKDSPTSWDEFPNGRFGDARSPAYGDLDGYGVGLKLPPAEALRQWGYPTTLADISQIFSSYLSGSLASIPWSEEPLRAETSSISKSLFRLNDERHWWTVGSQPAVDGAKSSDPVHGFGPKGGYVYQKAFVEFFLEEEKLNEFEQRARKAEEERQARGEGEEGLIKWFAGNLKGDTRSNMKAGDVNAVTWGVFGAKEIITTTLIEEISFKAWNVRSNEIKNALNGCADPSLIPGRSIRYMVGVVAPVSRQFGLSKFH